MTYEVPCIKWNIPLSREAALAQLGGLCHSTEISSAEMASFFSFLLHAVKIYDGEDISQEEIENFCFEKNDSFFCDMPQALQKEHICIDICHTCPYSDSFKNARIDKEKQLLYSLFDRTILPGSLATNKINDIFKSECEIGLNELTGKWPVVPFYQMLYHVFLFANATSNVVELSSVKELFFTSSYAKDIPLYADMCNRSVEDIQTAFSFELQRFIDGYNHISLKEAFDVLSYLAQPYKRICAAHREELGIKKASVRKRAFLKKTSLPKEKPEKKDVLSKKDSDSQQMSLYPEDILSAMQENLNINILPNGKIAEDALSKNNGSSCDAAISDIPTDTTYPEVTPALDESSEDISLFMPTETSPSEVKNEDPAMLDCSDVSASVYPCYRLDFLDVFIEDKTNFVTEINPFNMAGFEVHSHKETSCCAEIALFKDTVGLLLYLPSSDKFYMVSPNYLTGGISYFLKNVSMIYTRNAAVLYFYLNNYALSASHIYDVSVLLDTSFSEKSNGFFSDFSSVLNISRESISTLTERMKYYPALWNHKEMLEFSPLTNKLFLFWNDYMGVLSSSFYINSEGKYSSGISKINPNTYSTTQISDVFKNRISIRYKYNKNDAELRKKILFSYRSALIHLFQKHFFHAFGFHVLSVSPEQGVLLSFDYGSFDNVNDLLWDVFTQQYYSLFEERMVLELCLVEN